MKEYNHQKIEKKWAEKWVEDKTFTSDLENAKNPYYALFMFPYPSAEGLHIGNFYAFVCVDVMAKYKRLNGFDVFEPFGFDAFGIHLENYALKIGELPQSVEARTTFNFRKQVQAAGLSCDYTREVDTTKPEYYKWTQWIFTQLFKKGLAYQKEALLNWCPSCKTVLADEQIENGECERCGTAPEKRKMRQWFFKITEYAQRLLDGLETMDWSDITKAAQRNWIGRSEGAEIEFKVKSKKLKVDESIKVFTTRPDTLFGATYMVLSPEHELISNLKSQISNLKEVEEYIKKSGAKSDLERTENKDKTGVQLKGINAINPANNEQIPIWIADYVLMGYGTGAIMAVPAHDERDWEFAKKFDLPIKVVVKNPEEFGDVDQEKLDNYLIEIFKLAKKENFFVCVIGGYAKSLLNKENFIKSDIDLFVDKRGWDIISKYFEQKNFQENKPSKEYNWNNAKSIFDKDTLWLDLFLLGRENNKYFDEITGKKFEWGTKDDFITHDFKGVKVLTPNKELLDKIYFNFSRSLDVKLCYINSGISVNSAFLNGLKTEEAKKKMIEWLEEKGVGKGVVNYKLRDWCISRQRYWGPPVPVIYCDKCGAQAVPEEDLPVKLPELSEGWEPAGDGRGPLAKQESFMKTKCPKCGGEAEREPDVMDNFLDSAWYFFRYLSPHNDEKIFDTELGKKWLPVDLYVGGNEHAVLHLMYTRFITMALHDFDLIDFDNPFKRFRANGMILKDDKKMSKSKGNVVNPEEYGEKVGYDALKTYLLFLGPLSEDRSFTDKGVLGTRRWAEKIAKLEDKVEDNFKDNGEVVRKLHQTIKQVSDDFEDQKYNTAIARLMELANTLSAQKKISKDLWQKAIVLFAPFLPALSEELWSNLGNKDSIFKGKKWPEYDADLAKEEKIELVIQVNGKIRDKVEVDADIAESDAIKLAKESENIKKWLEGKEIVKEVFVKGKLINIVIK